MPAIKAAGLGRQASAIGLLVESIKASFNLQYFVIPIVVFILQVIAFFAAVVAAAPFAFLGMVFLVSLAPVGAFLLITAAVIFLIVLFVAFAVTEGFYIKSIDEYLKTKGFSMEGNLRLALGKWKKLTATYFLQVIIILLIAFITLLPAVVLSIGQFANLPPELFEAMRSNNQETIMLTMEAYKEEIVTAVVPAVGMLGMAFLAFILVNFLIGPLLFLWIPAVVFGENSFFECIAKGYSIGRAKYLRNLAVLFLFGVITIAINGMRVMVLLTGRNGLEVITYPLIVVGVFFALWLGLVYNTVIVKAYREG